MRKVLIFGNSGSGKSTLAKQLRDSECLNHLDLDVLAWEPTTPPKRKPIAESAVVINQFMSAAQGWVIEGCYIDLLEVALPQANEIIYLNLSEDLCIQNAKARPWEPHKYESKEAQDANLAMLIDWISQYSTRTDTFSRQAHQRFFEKFPGKKTIYTDNERNT